MSLMKFGKFSRDFLSPNKETMDCIFWSVRITEGWLHVEQEDNITWNAVLTIRYGNTSINIHSHNEETDVHFVHYKAKLNKLKQCIQDFLEKAPKHGKKEHVTHRVWLNEDSIRNEHYFNGYCVYSFASDSLRLSIADCHRVIVFSLYVDHDQRWVKKSNGKMVRILENIINNIDKMLETIEQGSKEYNEFKAKETLLPKKEEIC